MMAAGNNEAFDRVLHAEMVTSADVQHILIRSGNESETTITNELEVVNDHEDLLTAREELFVTAVGRFKEELEAKGINEKVHLEIKKRQITRGSKDKGIRAVCNDIVGLYHYCMRLSDVFPKDTIAAPCIGRYVNLSKGISKKQALEAPECNGASHILMIAQVNELKDLVVKQEGTINKQQDTINDLLGRVKALEDIANALQLDTTLAKSSNDRTGKKINMTKQVDLSSAKEEDGEISIILVHEEGSGGGQINGTRSGVKGDSEPKKDSPRSNAIGSVLHDVSVPAYADSGEEQSQQVAEEVELSDEDGDNDDDWIEVNNGSRKNKAGPTTKDSDAWKPFLNMKSGGKIDQSQPMDFSRIGKMQGPYNRNLDVDNSTGKQLKVTINGHHSQKNDRVVSNPKYGGFSSLISGTKWERSTMLYVRNIAVEERSDEEIQRDVIKYGKMVGMRIMQVDVEKNRFCQDVVGCRIKVPISQAEKAESVGTWPDDVVCRKWESKRRYNGNGDTPSYGNYTREY
jgi:hypothetical protein